MSKLTKKQQKMQEMLVGFEQPASAIETIKKLPKMYFTNITGGEPFIREDLPALNDSSIDYLVDKNQKIY